ncbi:LIM domain only protein 7-like isoform X2 [Genypterus blacodes]|uniref:LIM domain only protein 7-like isoform X2 n=1 Tax=Genypterus blacodes TaxID=154954 RepID=UPI003F770048
MEWRQQSSLSCADAFQEAQRWIEEVTGKSFGSNNFRAALDNGVLLCDLINQLKPGLIKRLNRLSTPIAGLDNVNVFLKACEKLGLNEAQLFHPGDLQDLSTRATLRRFESNRRLKNVLITIYWLGRKAQLDPFYNGPQLNFKAFEGLLGLALSKALDDGCNVFVRDGGLRECWYPQREESQHMKRDYKREDSVDSIDYLDSRGLRPSSEGCGSDAEAEQGFRMEAMQPAAKQNRGNIPPPLMRRKQRRWENGGCISPLNRACQLQVRPGKPPQVNPGWIWSKSLSDIPIVYPVFKVPDGNSSENVGQDPGKARDWNQGYARRSSAAAKDGEAKWQDDLTKWKNRRRSSKSDFHKIVEEREHVINQMTNGAVANNDTQGAQLHRDQQSPSSHYPAPCPSSASPTSESTCAALRPHTRALLCRSYATDAPFTPAAAHSPRNSAHTQGSLTGAMPASDHHAVGEKTYSASLASDGAVVTTPSLDCPFSSQTQVKAQGCPEATSRCGFADSAETLSSPKDHAYARSRATSFFDSAVNQTAADALDFSQQAQKASWDQGVVQGRGQQASGPYRFLGRPGSWSGSATLPRGYRRSEGSSRLSAAITARPFGTKQARVSSLPRLNNVEDNQGLLLNSEQQDRSLQPLKSTLKRQVATSQMKSQFQVKQNGPEQKRDVGYFEAYGQTNGCQTQPLAQSHLNLQHSKNLTAASTDIPKVDHSDMRVSLTLKPNSRPDFGFQTHWDSTGVRVRSIQQGSPAELCQLCVDDEIVAVDGIAVKCMSSDQWKNKMTSAMQTGSITMDVRRYGNKDWSTNDGSHHIQPGQSRMTINLTAAAPMLMHDACCPDPNGNSAASTETTITKSSKLTGRTENGVQVTDGEYADDLRASRTQDYTDFSEKNLKKRAEFFKRRGGSESAISDLQVPSLSPSPSSWSWDHEKDRLRQEKWQEDQERLLQEQYQQHQEKLEAEWQRAQQDATGELSRKPENTCEMTNRPVSRGPAPLPANGSTDKTLWGKQSPDVEELKDAGSEPQSAPPGVQDNISEADWAEGSCGFARLSAAHRAKSMSTPALAGLHKQTKGDQRRSKGQSVSKAEHERQQILEEMKKRTQLLTDNSWIRQRSTSVNKEQVGAPIKRYDSLDNLQTWRQSPGSTTADDYPRPHSAAGGFTPPSRNMSSRYSTGGALPQKSKSWLVESSSPLFSGEELAGQTPPAPRHHGSVWAATNFSEEQRPATRFEFDTGSPTVSPATSYTSTALSPPCDQIVLHIAE